MEILWIVIPVLVLSLVSSWFVYADVRKIHKRTKRIIDSHEESYRLKLNAIEDYVSKIEKRMVRPFEDFKETNHEKVWLVIFTLNRKDLLLNTIASIRKHEPDVKILVVDNGSTDGAQQELMTLLNQGTIDKLIVNRKDSVPQWQKSFNIHQAFKMLSVEELDYIAWVDDDMEVTRPWVKIAIQTLDKLKDKSVKLVSLSVDEIQEAVHPTLETLSVEGTLVRIKGSFNGAFVFMPVSLLKQIGLPPIREGITAAAVEDWYYTRLFRAENWKVAAIDACIHLGYKQSTRENVEKNQK